MAKLRMLCALFLCALASFITAQNREVNWPMYAGDAQRSGWQKSETRITKNTAKDLQLLWKMKLDVPAKGPRSLLPPVILGRLISYRGFKELAFVGTGADIVYAIDADLGKMFWQKHLEYVSNEAQASGFSAACPGGLTAMPVLPTPPPGGRGAGPGAATGPFVSGPLSLYALSGDGRIHRVNTSTGDDMVQPVNVLPPNARASSLNIVENVIYTVTSRNCSDAPDAVWAIDLNGGDGPKTASFPLGGAGDSGLEGVAIGGDGTVYAGDSKTLYSLSARDLQLRRRFQLPGENATIVTSPVVFNYKSREILVVARSDGRIYALEPASQRIERSSPMAGSEGGISGVSTWEDANGTRWVFASVSGKGSSAGSIASFKVEEQGDRIQLSPGWVSREINSSVPSVIANGVVFAISGPGRAILYALDAATGKELYSSRNLVTAPASSTGLTIANGRVYFSTTDGTVYAFGIYMEH
jgi:outer membrane protein assembly factor BamB